MASPPSSLSYNNPPWLVVLSESEERCSILTQLPKQLSSTRQSKIGEPSIRHSASRAGAGPAASRRGVARLVAREGVSY